MKKISEGLQTLSAALLLTVAVLSFATATKAGTWSGIEPFKSRRADVLKILGEPVSDSPNGPLTFKVAGGIVSVSFVDGKFVRSKKLRPEVEGTVLQIVLQHENSSDTPESMNLARDHDFVRDASGGTAIYRNLKDGIIYTFINGKLKTTRYTFSEAQISHARH